MLIEIFKQNPFVISLIILALLFVVTNIINSFFVNDSYKIYLNLLIGTSYLLPIYRITKVGIETITTESIMYIIISLIAIFINILWFKKKIGPDDEDIIDDNKDIMLRYKINGILAKVIDSRYRKSWEQSGYYTKVYKESFFQNKTEVFSYDSQESKEMQNSQAAGVYLFYG